MSETSNKIKQTSKTVLAVVNITKIICCLGIACCLLSAIVLGIFHNEVDLKMDQLIGSGKITEYVSEGNIIKLGLNEQGSVTVNLMKEMMEAIIILIFFVILLHFISKIFKKFMENYSPFTKEIVKDLKIAFILITIVSLNSGIMMGLVIGIALYCLYQIFAYGCELQQQSDETL